MLRAVAFWVLLIPASVCPAAEKSAEAGDLNLSAAVEVSRQHQAWLSEAEVHLKAGRYAAAIRRLQNVLDAEPAFVPEAQVFENTHIAARRLLETLPPAWKNRYEEQFGGIAREELSAARAKNDHRAGRRVAGRYPSTRAGFEALRLSTIWHFDHGEFLAATAGFRDLSEQPFARRSNTLESADVLRWIIALSQLGLTDEARQIAKRYPKMASQSRAVLDEADAKKPEPLSSLPSSRAVWEQTLPMPEAAGKLVRSMREELEGRGFLPPANFSPIIAGNRVIARSPSEVMAYELSTGEIAWRKSTDSQLVGLAEQGLMAHPQFRHILAGQLAVEAFANRNVGTMTSDGSRVYLVSNDLAHDGFGVPNPWAFDQKARDDWHKRRFSCQLWALDAATGKEAWRSPPALPNRDLQKFSGRIRDPEPGRFFFGPPLPLGDSLFAIVQNEQEIQLDVLAAETGELEWSLPLAMTELPLKTDRKRRRLMCPVVPAGGQLLCPTSAGALAAVDPHSRTCRWIFRYVRDDVSKPIPGAWPPGDASETGRDQWWTGWRDVTVVVHNGIVLLASPESGQLHAISLRTGEPLWTLPRADGLFLANAGEGPVLVIGSKTVRAVNPETGRVVWTVPTPTPGGRGIVRETEMGSTYLLPLKAGGILEIDPARKTARRTFPNSSEPWGNLVTAGEAILMQTHDRLSRLAPLQPDADPPSDSKARLAWVKSEREAGRFREAARVLKELAKEPESQAMDVLRETLLLELSAHPERSPAVASDLEPLLDSSERRIAGWKALAEAQQRASRLRASLESWLKLTEENPTGLASVRDEPALEVEFSRLIQGAIRDLLDAADPGMRRQLEARLNEYRDERLNRRDPFAASRFARQFDQLKWGRELIAEEQHRTGIGQSALEQQLGLWALTEEADDPALKALAFRRLAEDRIAGLRYREAAFFLGQLKDHFAEVKFPEGLTAKEWIEKLPMDSPVHKYLAGENARWIGQARITEDRRPGKPPALYRIPLKAPPGSLCADLDLWLEPAESRSRLQISGGGHSGFWELPISQGAPDYGFLEAWGTGPVLILQDGTNLLGIAPLDDHGEPRPRILWRISLLNGEAEANLFELVGYRQHQPPPGFGVRSGELLDSFLQAIAQVGVVSAQVVVYQNAGRLVAVEPATGKSLWSRKQLPSEAMITGDARHVLLFERGRSRVTVFRTLDGRAVASRDLPPGELLTWWGSRALFREQSADHAAFSLWDAVSGRLVWEQQAPLKSLGFAVDATRWGFITSEGDVTILDGQTGRPLAATKLDSVREPSQVYAAGDEMGLYLAIAHAQGEQSPIVDDLPLRHPILAGSLHAFDRRTGKALWQTDARQFAFPLDQPAVGPVLVLYHREKADQGNPTAIVRCLEKRTGKEIYSAEFSAARETVRWSGHPDRGIFELDAYRNTVRFRYE